MWKLARVSGNVSHYRWNLARPSADLLPLCETLPECLRTFHTNGESLPECLWNFHQKKEKLPNTSKEAFQESGVLLLFRLFAYKIIGVYFEQYVEGSKTAINSGDVLLQIYFLGII